MHRLTEHRRNFVGVDYGTTARDFFTIVLDLGPIVERAP